MANDGGHIVVDAFSNAIVNRPPPPLAPFYRFEWSPADPPHAHQTAFFVPSAGAMYWQGPGFNGTGSDGWFDLGELAPSIERVSGDVAPFPAPVVRITVGGKAAKDPGSYMKLLSIGTPTRYAVQPLSRWLPIRIQTSLASPWQTTMYVARHKSVILRISIDAGVRNATVYTIPLRTANAIRMRNSLP
jgi:hypothetical protein